MAEIASTEIPSLRKQVAELDGELRTLQIRLKNQSDTGRRIPRVEERRDRAASVFRSLSAESRFSNGGRILLRRSPKISPRATVVEARCWRGEQPLTSLHSASSKFP